MANFLEILEPDSPTSGDQFATMHIYDAKEGPSPLRLIEGEYFFAK